ncbi:zinc finger SWIM domain-containing protein 7-like isoform X2 [Babylonia areolata]|uniref:zinc finger SWIM domain-containing protein 7-like isoform X2 n=1 Tax=Babylonia areolata TaxID=304850 RepID=UPI003FD28D48
MAGIREVAKQDQVKLVGDSLFQEADRTFKEHGKLTEEILSALHFVYQAPVLSALELVDKSAVSQLVSPSGRSVYQVIGSSGTPYTCLKTSHYCSCPAFTFSVLHKEDHMMCKHHLAVQIYGLLQCKHHLAV